MAEATKKVGYGDSLGLNPPISFIDKYKPEVNKILEAVKFAYDTPWTSLERKEKFHLEDAYRSTDNPYLQEVLNVLKG